MFRSMAKDPNRAICRQANGPADDELSRATWASTLEELEKDWVWRDVASECDDLVMAKRFELQRKEQGLRH